MGLAGKDLIVGALVRWTSAPGAPVGVVVGADWPRLKVRFDGDPDPKLFNAKYGALDRVALSGMVKRASTGSVGLLHAPATASPPRWQVILDGRLVTVAEADLRPHALDDPHSRVIEGRLGSARQFALAITARRYELEQRTNELVSLGTSRVAIKPHQVSVVHRVVTNYPHRFLLCDEVGLGKTIEAGMILKELRARGAAQRVLVVAPPNILRQWQFELKSKFNEAFSIINSETVKYLKNQQSVEENPFLAFDSVMVSSAWICTPKWAALATEAAWDMVIVDEAHHARVRRSGNRREENRLYKVVRDLASPNAFSKRAALFLTATPMQLDSGELYSLVELLDPALFPTEQHFNQHRAEVPGLSHLVHELFLHGFPLPDVQDEDVIGRVAGWLQIDEEEARNRLTGGASALEQLGEELSARHLISEVLIRNRKKIIGGFMPRHAHRWEVKLSAEERTALMAVEAYVRDGFAMATRTNDSAAGFVMVIFQKLMASSIRALRESLERRRVRLEAAALNPSLTRRAKLELGDLEDRLDRDEAVTAILDEMAAADAGEADELKRLVALLDAVSVDSKAATFLAQMDELRQLDPAAKVLLFTEFRETQEYLRGRLAAAGWHVEVFHGQLKPQQKDDAVDRFREATEPCILLCTEAGGEGRNFQFCHLLVNYDLPWNPMRVEQRIGRVDRIGQANTVQVFNFWVKATVEERVLNVLERRINIFEETVGGLDPILGEAERDLKKLLLLGGIERDRALERYETQLERQVGQARVAEEKLRDFIMETRSYSKEISRMLVEGESPVTPAAQEAFVARLLLDVKTTLFREPDGTFDLTFNEPFVSDFPQHVKDGMRRRRAAFRADVKPDSEQVEYLALGHPVVDDLVGRVTSQSYRGSAAAFEIDGRGVLEAATGWLVVYEAGVPAIKEVRELVPLFVDDAGLVVPLLGRKLLDRAADFPNDRGLSPADFSADSLDPALVVAEEEAWKRVAELEDGARVESNRQIDRERAKLTGYFDYRQQAAHDRLASSRAVLEGLEASEQPESRRILPVWRANVSRDERLIEELAAERTSRLAQLEHAALGGGDLRLVAVARIEILGEGA